MRRRFSLRSLFWLTLIVAIIVGWWADHRAMQTRLNARYNARRYFLVGGRAGEVAAGAAGSTGSGGGASAGAPPQPREVHSTGPV